MHKSISRGLIDELLGELDELTWVSSGKLLLERLDGALLHSTYY
jgi:hypothetical protein